MRCRLKFVLLLFAPVVLAMGCAEPVRIRSWPAGAKIYVDDQYVGTSPAVTKIPRSLVTNPHTWRIEFRNCDVAEGRLQTRVPGRRVAGYIFTLGIVAIFKGPHEFLPIDVEMQGGDCEGGTPAARRTTLPAPSGITIQNIVGDHNNAGSANSGSESKTRQLAEKLTTLRDLYNRKLITQEVYDREMQKAVQDSR